MAQMVHCYRENSYAVYVDAWRTTQRPLADYGFSECMGKIVAPTSWSLAEHGRSLQPHYVNRELVKQFGVLLHGFQNIWLT